MKFLKTYFIPILLGINIIYLMVAYVGIVKVFADCHIHIVTPEDYQIEVLDSNLSTDNAILLTSGNIIYTHISDCKISVLASPEIISQYSKNQLD